MARPARTPALPQLSSRGPLSSQPRHLPGSPTDLVLHPLQRFAALGGYADTPLTYSFFLVFFALGIITSSHPHGETLLTTFGALLLGEVINDHSTLN